MSEVEVRVVSDRKERLLLELGQVVIGSGFTLLRQRMNDSAEGVVLTLIIRGPDARLLDLEERLATHHLVQSFEASVREAGGTAPVAEPAPTSSGVNGHARQPSRDRPASSQPGADRARLEIILPMLAQDYPQILPRLIQFEQEVAAGNRDTTMRYAGSRVGAWVYKRDFALGARLGLRDSVRHIALPAVRQLIAAELDGENLRLKASPFCGSVQAHGRSCHFFRGFFEGLLNESRSERLVAVEEAVCRSSGASFCTFIFRD